MMIHLSDYELTWLTDLLLLERDQANTSDATADYDWQRSDTLLAKMQEAATPFTNATTNRAATAAEIHAAFRKGLDGRPV